MFTFPQNLVSTRANIVNTSQNSNLRFLHGVWVVRAMRVVAACYGVLSCSLLETSTSTSRDRMKMERTIVVRLVCVSWSNKVGCTHL